MKIQLANNDFFSIEAPETLTLQEASALSERLKKIVRLFADEVGLIEDKPINRTSTKHIYRRFSEEQRKEVFKIYKNLNGTEKLRAVNEKVLSWGIPTFDTNDQLTSWYWNNIKKYGETENETEKEEIGS